MPAPNAVQQVQEVPVKIVGGSNFGRYPKISVEQTWNMIVSDGALVPYAGYKNALVLSPTDDGRGIYASFTGEIMIAVVGRVVYRIKINPVTGELESEGEVGVLETNGGDVYIAENNNQQICITDGVYAYIYNYGTNQFYSSSPTLPPGALALAFTFPNPGYVSFQNGRFLVASQETQYWILSGVNDGLDWPQYSTATTPPTVTKPSQIGTIQTKPTTAVAAIPVPGGGNNLIVLGTNCGESWQDVGNVTFPYQRGVTFNIDYGCLNASSISKLDNFIVWLAYNEASGPMIMTATGSQIQRISTDGIDYVLSNLTNPTNCTGFLFRQDGHIIYQFTFPDDNISYIYDFNTGLFFNVSNEKLDYHIARQVVFFNNTYYFVPLDSGNIYEFSTKFTDAIYSINNELVQKELPRLRITPPTRLPTQRYFIGKSIGFTIENGQPNIKTLKPTVGSATPTVNWSEAVDLSISIDGGETFGNSWRLNMNPTGKRTSRFIWQRLGIVNDVSFQFRFSGFGRFIAFDGILEIYQ